VTFWDASAIVPLLVDDGFAVWDTLAIVEYLAEKHPDLRIWPEAARERARARSLCAEMHSGFGALRDRFHRQMRERTGADRAEGACLARTEYRPAADDPRTAPGQALAPRLGRPAFDPDRRRRRPRRSGS